MHKILIKLVMFSIVTWGECALAGTQTTEYTYDDLGRIVNVVKQSDNISRNRYEYDATDNRLNKNSLATAPFSAILISSRTVQSTSNSGTSAKYKLKSDGTIQVTETVSFSYGGGVQKYDMTSISGRWISSEYAASRFTIQANTFFGAGYTSCTSGPTVTWIPGHYEPEWTMKLTPGYSGCRINILIKEGEFVLGSAQITLLAGS